MAVGNRKNDGLYGRQPKRERACKMLYKNADKSLYRAENNAVNHNGAVLFAVGTRVFKIKSLWKLEVKLNSTALPGSAERIFNVEVKLRTVERTVALIYGIFLTNAFDCVGK